MFEKITFALLLTAGLLANASAADATQSRRMRSSERPIETETTGLPLPRSVPGSITLRPCEMCAPVTLAVTPASAFVVDSKPVTLADLRALASSSSANVVVFYDSNTNAVTRIVVSDVR